jgi:DNA repair protein RecO (recombination protein O)
MEWTDDALILSLKGHGEANVVVEVLTRARGRHLGLMRGGRGRRHQAMLQPGNEVIATWRGRLETHLGQWRLEPSVARAGEVMASARALNGVQALASLVRLLPERDPHDGLYDAALEVIDRLIANDRAGEAMVRFELMMLDELGFGLDLTSCALGGPANDLAFVSPKSGRAASRAKAQGLADRLLPLPRFLVDETLNAPPDLPEVESGLRLTAHFLERHVYQPRGLNAPLERARFIATLA